MKSYIQIAHINDGYLLGGINRILHKPGKGLLRENGSVRPQEFPLCPQLPCAIVMVKIKSWRKVPNMTQLFFTLLEGVHAATLICLYKRTTIRLCVCLSHTPELFQGVEMGLTMKQNSQS